MDIKQLLLKIKAFGVDITALKEKDVQLEELIERLKEQVGEIDNVSEEIERQITEALEEFENKVDEKDEAIKEELQKAIEELEGQMTEGTNYTNEMETVVDLGGIPAGSTFEDVSITDMFTKLLYPYVKPEVSASSTPNGGTFEKGNNQQVTKINATVKKKSEKITKIEYLDGQSVLGEKNGDEVEDGGSFDLTVSQEVSDNKNFSVKVTDASGKFYTVNTGAFNFVYPYFFGKVAADKTSLTGQEIYAMTKKIEDKGNKSFTFDCDNERMVIAYPKAHGQLKSIIDPNGFDNFSAFVKTEVSVTGLDSTPQDYFVYINGPSTVSNFTMKFNY